MLHGAREVESKIVSGLGHWRERRIALESGIADGKKLGECSLLLRLRDDVEPDAKNVGVLAEVSLRGRVSEQTIFLIPAQFAYALKGALHSFPIDLCASAIAIRTFQFCGVAKGFDKLQSNDR